MRNRKNPGPACWIALLLLVCLLPVICLGDDDTAPPAPPAKRLPKATVAGGFGNTMGGLGIQGEYYFGRGRVSAFAGVGYWPGSTENEIYHFPGGAAFAMGGRAFTRGLTNRAFVEASVSRLAHEGIWTTDGTLVQKSILYGPGVALGYQHVSEGGLVFFISTGVGYASGTRTQSAELVFTIGMGKMWRR